MTDCKSTLSHRIDVLENNIIKGSLDFIPKKSYWISLPRTLFQFLPLYKENYSLRRRGEWRSTGVSEFHFNLLFLVLYLVKLKHKMKMKSKNFLIQKNFSFQHTSTGYIEKTSFAVWHHIRSKRNTDINPQGVYHRVPKKPWKVNSGHQYPYL